MKPLSLAVIVFFSTMSLTSLAGTIGFEGDEKKDSRRSKSTKIQNAECIGPADAPVRGIYLHGWFPANAKLDDWKSALERGNRRQLAQLAAEQGIRIAVPIGTFRNNSGDHSWFDERKGGTYKSVPLKDIEEASRVACGADLAVPRVLIGFSSGGFRSRDIALSCGDHIKSEYSAIVMSGAEFRPGGFGNKKYDGCPNFFVGHGVEDPGVDGATLRRQVRKLQANYPQSQYGNYPGRHVMPPNSILSRFFASTGVQNDNVPAANR